MQTELSGCLVPSLKGDEAAFERLYAATRAKLYGVLLRILGRPALAEEVMQETYLKVWKMADQFDPADRKPDHLDGGDGAQPRHRYRAQARRSLDRG